jgi:2-hydroxychromene-2-carboxylate isomerase
MRQESVLDFWLDYASTYSYPAAERISVLAHATGVRVRRRPFLLGPIFKAQGWDTSPFNIYPQKGEYMWRDVARICHALGLPFEPSAQQFPQNSLLAARTALVGFADGWGEDFSRAVYNAEFAEGLNIAEPGVIAAILKKLGLNAAHVMERAQSAANKALLRNETGEAQRLGIFGAPSFVTADGELFWGNDRLEPALAWAAR